MSTRSRARLDERPLGRERGDQALVDILGIGFGPANLGLGIAFEEHNEKCLLDDRLTIRFLEAKSAFGWHKGMLLPKTTMQISFLKDLVSLRSPTSSYSFLNYLHERNRLSDFINLKTFFPTRVEYYDYLLWAANRLDLPVSYNAKAEEIDWNGENFVVTVTRGDKNGAVWQEVIHARHIVLGMGYQPVLPEGVETTSRIFHSQNLLSRLDGIPSLNKNAFLVVGAGQSAAEVVAYLHDTYPQAEVHASLRRFGYSPSDDTPFVNRIFDPAAVDEFFTAPQSLKDKLLTYHWPTNYAAVDADLIEELYRRTYEETLSGIKRLHMHRTSEIESLSPQADGVHVVLRDLGLRYRKALSLDAVIFATGFKPFNIERMLGAGVDVKDAFQHGQPVVNRDYSLNLKALEGRIFLNGSVEHSHGLTSTLLSNISMRASDILDAITSLRRHVDGNLRKKMA